MTDQPDNTPAFVIPDDINKAKMRHRSLRTDIAEINDQLAESKINDRPDQQWLKSAKYALRKKREEYAALSDHISEHRERCNAIRDAQGGVQIIAHLRYHSKLVGRFNNLLLAAEAFIENDCEETYEALGNAVDEIRQMDASS